jgi:hypothetical protein
LNSLQRQLIAPFGKHPCFPKSNNIQQWLSYKQLPKENASSTSPSPSKMACPPRDPTPLPHGTGAPPWRQRASRCTGKEPAPMSSSYFFFAHCPFAYSPFRLMPPRLFPLRLFPLRLFPLRLSSLRNGSVRLLRYRR